MKNEKNNLLISYRLHAILTGITITWIPWTYWSAWRVSHVLGRWPLQFIDAPQRTVPNNTFDMVLNNVACAFVILAVFAVPLWLILTLRLKKISLNDVSIYNQLKFRVCIVALAILTIILDPGNTIKWLVD